MKRSFAVIILLFSSWFTLSVANAASNIDPEQSFAWSETSGWLNFLANTNIGVEVTGTHLKGFIWAENIGWIKLGADNSGPYSNTNATDWGVNRAGNGQLSGFAWSENVGWINFGSDLAIVRADGEFDGYAWSENVGWIHLRNTNPAYGVRALLEALAEEIFSDQFE